MILPFDYELNGVGVAMIFAGIGWGMCGMIALMVDDLSDRVKKLEARSQNIRDSRGDG